MESPSKLAMTLTDGDTVLINAVSALTLSQPDNGFSVENFVALVRFLEKNTFLFGDDPDITVPPARDMKLAVEKSRSLLPAVYQKDYCQPLLAQWDQWQEQIQGDAMAMETLCAVVYQRNAKYLPASHRAPLNRFQVVVDRLYDGFLSRSKRLHLNLPLVELEPSLAMFQRSGEAGPFTITAEVMQQLCGAGVAVVSLPGDYAKHPVLWAALGHEVGGHDVLHADPGLLEELGSAVAQEIGGDLGKLWQYWIDESASDIYGTLVYGPHFTLNLAFFFAVLNLQAGSKQWMRTKSYADPYGRLDPHPTDILRLSIGVGVVTALTQFSADNKAKYVAMIKQIIEFVRGDETEIEIDGMGKFPMAKMQEIAEKVGRIVATRSLNHFRGKSVQDIDTWTDAEEAKAFELACKMRDSPSANLLHTSAHILSAATMAVLADPSAYGVVTENVERLLDQKYAHDKRWSQPTKRQLYVRGPVRPPAPSAEGAAPKRGGMFSLWG